MIALTQAGEKKWTVRGIGDADALTAADPVCRAAGSARGVAASDKEFAANGTVTAGRKLDKAKNEFAGAVRKWALDEQLMVKKRLEWWARVAISGSAPIGRAQGCRDLEPADHDDPVVVRRRRDGGVAAGVLPGSMTILT